eukprot:189193_1
MMLSRLAKLSAMAVLLAFADVHVNGNCLALTKVGWALSTSDDLTTNGQGTVECLGVLTSDAGTLAIPSQTFTCLANTSWTPMVTNLECAKPEECPVKSSFTWPLAMGIGFVVGGVIVGVIVGFVVNK